jgi:hypothetical protein
MSKIDRFIAAVMGIPDVSKTSCSMCSCRSMRINSWSDCHSCIRDGLHIHFSLHDSLRKYISWSASSNGEISYPVRKWFQEHEPDVWEKYLISCLVVHTPAELKVPYTTILEAQLSIQNFYDYLRAHWQEWGDIDEYTPDGKSRRICKYPAAEKIMREEG